MLDQPKLIQTTSSGGTIHSYQLTGGTTIFNRYLSCYLGTCSFFSDLESAQKHLTDCGSK